MKDRQIVGFFSFHNGPSSFRVVTLLFLDSSPRSEPGRKIERER
jgi:hypothetical protein